MGQHRKLTTYSRNAGLSIETRLQCVFSAMLGDECKQRRCARSSAVRHEGRGRNGLLFWFCHDVTKTGVLHAVLECWFEYIPAVLHRTTIQA